MRTYYELSINPFFSSVPAVCLRWKINKKFINFIRLDQIAFDQSLFISEINFMHADRTILVFFFFPILIIRWRPMFQLSLCVLLFGKLTPFLLLYIIDMKLYCNNTQHPFLCLLPFLTFFSFC